MASSVYLKSEAGEVIVLPDGQSNAGTNPGGEILLDGVGASANQAAFLRRGNETLIIDLGSENGTFVNGQRIDSKQWSALKDGDIVRFGGWPNFTVFWF
ncbi:MAG TPA: FHA domain-containing protein [Thermoanaerobaculia bacterium]|nr:FHA domain-containing protein [Thermoanaerobaculia bacterium]